ncbi:MAG: nucleotidyltransferase domain-containing protein [Sedimentisphaerales bacterium]|nr:nucleotidyltransferase domain-containing protein [Sedimentisphaerales bacterium]
MFTEQEKQFLKQEIAGCLKTEAEVRRIIIFGSFLTSDDPHDLDVAIVQDSDENYLPLALKYRKKTRDIARRIPLEIIPLRVGAKGELLMSEIEKGEVIYER